MAAKPIALLNIISRFIRSLIGASARRPR